jgi:hypothetical protein
LPQSLEKAGDITTTILAEKLVCKKVIKQVVKKFCTDIIQESTDAVYQFEDDSITLADFILRSVLKQEIRNIISGEIKNPAKMKRHMRRIATGVSDLEMNIPSEYSPSRSSANRMDTIAILTEEEDLRDIKKRKMMTPKRASNPSNP